MKILIFLFIILTIPGFVIAQEESDASLAKQYMASGEYGKAAELYKKLYNENPNGNYKNYYTSLLSLNDIKEINRIIERQLKKTPENLTLYVDLGYAYGKQGNTKQRDEAFEMAISKIRDHKPQVVQLANAFMSVDEPEYAVAAYEKGKKAVPEYTFNYELAGLYNRAGNFEKSINTYLDYLNESHDNFQKVSNALQRMLDEEKDHLYLQAQLFEKIQKSQNEIVFTELLIWDYIQLKDYDGAFIQAKALDKRYKEDGERIFDLGETARNEGQYDAAIKCFNYIIDKGKDSPYYFSAKNGILNCRKEKIFKTNTYTKLDLQELRNNYTEFLSEYGRDDSRAASVTADLARLEGFYEHNIDNAIDLLGGVVTWPSLNLSEKSAIKLDLGDFYLIKGDVWEATLLYSQVDKAMKDEPLGEQARYKNARLAYYRGDFNYSQGLLDVLKAATSELVANDAMKLSVFITENLGLDSVAEPMQLFSQADLLVFQNKPNDAVIILDTLNARFPGHSLTDDILFLKSEIALKNQEVDKAVEMLENLRQNYGFELLADDAIFKLGELYQYDLKDIDNAKLCYEQIILNYQDSLYVNEARKRYRDLRGDQL